MESAGLGRSRCIRYDGGWETVYWLDGEGALVLPQQVLASYRLPAGGTVQVGRVCAQSVELWPDLAGEATVSPGGLLRVPLAVWGRTAMQPGRSWLGLLPFRQTLFLVDRGLL